MRFHLVTTLLLVGAGHVLGFSGSLAGGSLGLRNSDTPRCRAGPGKLQMTAAPLRFVRTAFQEGTQSLGSLFTRPEAPEAPEHISALQSTEHLVEWLENKAGVDIKQWGNGKAKKPEHLLMELRAGESTLSPEGVRVVKVAKVRIMDGDHELIEVRQHLRNGVTKERNRALAEKFQPGEAPLEAAARGIREELGQLIGTDPEIKMLSSEAEVKPYEERQTSTSYPGLVSVYQLYKIEAEVVGLNRETTGMIFETGEECDLDGYCDKIHVWEWRPRKSGKSSRRGGPTGNVKSHIFPAPFMIRK